MRTDGHTGRWTNSNTDITKLTVTFCNFLYSPNYSFGIEPLFLQITDSKEDLCPSNTNINIEKYNFSLSAPGRHVGGVDVSHPSHFIWILD